MCCWLHNEEEGRAGRCEKQASKDVGHECKLEAFCVCVCVSFFTRAHMNRLRLFVFVYKERA